MESTIPDYNRIKRNISSMIDQNAPETDISAYIEEEEGVTLDQLQAAPKLTHASKASPKAAHAPNSAAWSPSVQVVKDGRSAALSVYPGLKITQVERDPNSALGRANPSSWHNRSHGAIDAVPIKGMSFEEYVEGYRKAGYSIVQAINEDEAGGGKRSGHATGDHWHVVLGPQAEGTEETVDVPNPVPSPVGEGLDGSVTDTGAGYDAEVSPSATNAPAYSYGKDQDESGGFFRLPEDWNEFGKGLEYGAGAVVEGIGDTLGIVGNPLSTVLGRAMGYMDYTADLGGSMRDALGLDRPAEGDTANRIAGDIVSGATGGLAFSGLAGAAGRATGSVAQQALAKLGATPIRDAVAGGTSALAADGAEAMGAGPLGQTAAAIVGGGVGGLGIAPKGTQALAPVAERLVPKLAQQRFEARQAMSKYKAVDREISADMRKLVDGLKPAGKLSKADKVTLLDRVSEREASYLPYDDLKALALAPSAKAKLASALDRRHLLGEDEIDALADGTPAGDATTLAIRKARRLRAQVPEVAGRSSVSAGRFLAEALAGTAGFKVGGFPGYAIGSAAARKLTRSGANSSADKALALASDHSKWAKMPLETYGETVAPDATEVLKRIADKTRDASYLAKRDAAEEAERLATEGRNALKANALDNIAPGGGYRGLIYDRTGLLPAAQDAGVLSALRDGKITSDQFDAFLRSPENLMQGNAGNALADRLASMADDGKLARDPKWTKPEPVAPTAPMVDAQGQPIRSMPAYQAGVAKNVARDLPLLQELDAINVERTAKYDSDPEFRKIAGSQADPYFSRIKALQDTLERNRSGGGVAK